MPTLRVMIQLVLLLVFVAGLRTALGRRFQRGRAPRVVFVDRGRGFYNAGTGVITPEFKAALAQHNLKPFMGDHASQQPGALQEMMLHETAVAWIRRCLTWSLPAKPWEESLGDYSKRLKEVVHMVNSVYDVEGLCKELPQRVQALRAAHGGRLPK